ncbi:MAG: LysR family transcriptional regulator [Myxococcota bacterium]
MDTDTISLRAFSRVARRQSFAEAARELRMSTTAVSRRVAHLEQTLGVRLLHRTTRHVSLTTAGALALERAEQILADLDDLGDLMDGDERPRGHVRMTAGVSFGHAVLHAGLPRFLHDHPEVSVELVLTDRPVDLVTERIDLAVRIGHLGDSSLVARRLGEVPHLVCAAPRWVEGEGLLSIDDLAGLPRIVDTNQPRVWRLQGPDDMARELSAEGRYAVNNAHAALDACRTGLGLALLPCFVADEALAHGEIVDVLPGWTGPRLGVHSVVLQRRWASTAVRRLVAHVQTLIPRSVAASPASARRPAERPPES